ncbi:hypothetical protein B566_EDAN002484 [Ephemera danica]|nr:hypothetical protein B566_EDAN002484 [Ephemera danica]
MDTTEKSSTSEARPQFGNRFLKNPEDVFQHNAWDNVEWGTEQENQARKKVDDNSAVKASDKVAPGHKSAYTSAHTQQDDTSSGDNKSLSILEVGCGVGNTVIPILKTNNDPNLRVYACDFSSTAVELLQQDPNYDTARCGAFVCDVTSEEWTTAPFPAASLDVAILVFVLSAIHPDKMAHVARQLFYYLKPGGVVLFRDYGRYDLAQLRFKQGRCLSDNFYVRGDGTREVRDLFTSAGFIEEQNLVDRRLQVNRGKQLTMYRVWVQAKFCKPCT